MKIALIGTHGIGKTTLAHDIMTRLKKRGIDAGFLSEIVRECPFPVNENTTRKSQLWIMLMQIIKELEFEERYGVLICDRSVLDSYCYYAKKFGKSEVLEPLIKKHLETYALIIKVPLRDGFLKDDKFRSTDKKFQKDIDEKMDGLLKKFGVNFASISSEEENEKIIGKIIKKLN